MIVRKMKVKCELVIEIDVPEPYQHEDYDPFFDIEENHCPGTGIVGGAIDAIIAKHEAQSTCWACALQGKNTILEINGEPVTPGGSDAARLAHEITSNAWAAPAPRYPTTQQVTIAATSTWPTPPKKETP